MIRSLLLLSAALAVGIGFAACSVDAGSPTSGEPKRSAPTGAGELDGITAFGTVDSGLDASRAPGSPLCGASPDRCMPDDDGTGPSYGAKCASPPPDAGSASVEGDAAARAQADGCRIAKEADIYAPKCFVGEADRRGTDGVACVRGADCAPGFDCVDSEQGGVCRRYCCSGSCANQTGENGGPTFCDIQRLVGTTQARAPVCMPFKKCQLLVANSCGERETCALVNEKGDTGCVPRGGQKAGDSCDQEHCALGLTCLGSPGDRRCYKLCKVRGDDCGATQTCVTGAVFRDPSFGVCK